MQSRSQKDTNIFQNDLEQQLLAWSDEGRSMRTETDLNDLNGADIFVERHWAELE